jgi:hypothetical protein
MAEMISQKFNEMNENIFGFRDIDDTIFEN